MHVSAASLAPDRPVRKATPSNNTERTARSGAAVETIFLSRPRRAQCNVFIYLPPPAVGRPGFKEMRKGCSRNYPRGGGAGTCLSCGGRVFC